MKKVSLILLILVLFSCVPKYKYKITTQRGETFYCTSYVGLENGCISFDKSPGLNNTPSETHTICGIYKIEKLK